LKVKDYSLIISIIFVMSFRRFCREGRLTGANLILEQIIFRKLMDSGIEFGDHRKSLRFP